MKHPGPQPQPQPGQPMPMPTPNPQPRPAITQRLIAAAADKFVLVGLLLIAAGAR